MQPGQHAARRASARHAHRAQHARARRARLALVAGAGDGLLAAQVAADAAVHRRRAGAGRLVLHALATRLLIRVLLLRGLPSRPGPRRALVACASAGGATSALLAGARRAACRGAAEATRLADAWRQPHPARRHPRRTLTPRAGRQPGRLRARACLDFLVLARGKNVEQVNKRQTCLARLT